ncbi:hypothetical protein FACS18945_5180 [Bacteroidia bacterium]|nr:hypothetical protein FACS18945_5180 [Bacteroidia bacterium]
MYTLNDSSRKIIEKRLNLRFSDVISMDAHALDKVVEVRIGKRLKNTPISDERLIGRGSPYLYLNRFIEFNRKELNKYDDLKLLK